MYIQEEIGRERWILSDLKSCGLDVSDTTNLSPPMATRIMVAYLYDQAQRRNPVGVLGMVLVLEGTSAALATTVAALVKEQVNLGDDAVTYLSSHGELDQGHLQFFEQTVNGLTREDDLAAIIECARVVYHLYGEVYRSLPMG